MAVKWMFRYIKGSINNALSYGGARVGEQASILDFSNADYAADIDKRRFTAGYVFKLWNSTISWKSSLQHVVALLTTDAECIAISEAIKEAMWLKGLVSELLGVEVKATLMCDSQSAIHLSKNHAHHERTKHIDIRYHFIRQVIENKSVILTKVSGEENTADIFTKAVPVSKLKLYLDILKLTPSDMK